VHKRGPVAQFYTLLSVWRWVYC